MICVHPDYRKKLVFCANCGGLGHIYKTCNHPIISYGIICYKPFYDKITNSVYPKYLMVQRKSLKLLYRCLRRYFLMMMKQGQRLKASTSLDMLHLLF